jgi:hypothetical protein
LVWQSPGVCCEVAVPGGAKVIPHWFETHVRVWHSVSVPGQLPGLRHWTQVPEPLQSPFGSPLSSQAKPGGRKMVLGTPPLQLPTVQSLLGGAFVSSATDSHSFPLHTVFWQEPAAAGVQSVSWSHSSATHVPPAQWEPASHPQVPPQPSSPPQEPGEQFGVQLHWPP